MVSQATALVALAERDFEAFHDALGEPYAAMQDGRETYAVRSGEFAERLAGSFYHETGIAPSQAAVTTAVLTLALQAREGPESPVFIRVGWHGGRVVLDLADAKGHVVVCGPGGWEVTQDSPVRFLRPAGMLPAARARARRQCR